MEEGDRLWKEDINSGEEETLTEEKTGKTDPTRTTPGGSTLVSMGRKLLSPSPMGKGALVPGRRAPLRLYLRPILVKLRKTGKDSEIEGLSLRNSCRSP